VFFVCREDVENFHAGYLLASVPAKNPGQNPTSIPKKSNSPGVQTVFDERFDKLISEIFKRGEVSNTRAADRVAIRWYPTRTGRPAESASKPSRGVLVPEAATSLGITVEQVGPLSRPGVLVRTPEDSCVPDESFNDLQRRCNDPAHVL
jgi:hypothetical protein